MTRAELRAGTFMAPSMQSTHRFVIEEVGRRLGVSTELVVGRSPEQLLDGDLDIAFLNAPAYVRHADLLEPLAAPILSGSRFGGAPVSYSDVIVPAESDIRSFDDLRGKAFAFSGEDSFAGYWAVLDRLAQDGERRSFFSRWHRSGWHQVAIDLVAEAAVEGAAVDCQVLAVEWRNRPHLARLVRVVDQIGPYPSPPVVAAKTVSADLREALRTTLAILSCDTPAHQVLCRAFVERYVAIDDAHFDPIRQMLASASRAAAVSAV